MTDALTLSGLAGLYRLAGYCTLAAIATLVVAAVALGFFFGGAGDIYGPINDIFTAVTLLLLIPAVWAIRQMARGSVGGWFSLLSMVTIVGLLEAAVGFVLLVVGAIDLVTSFVTFGVGMLPFLAWVAAVAYLSLRGRLLSRTVGWWIGAFLVLTALSILALPFFSMEVMTFTLWPVLAVTLAGWLVALGWELLRRANEASA